MWVHTDTKGKGSGKEKKTGREINHLKYSGHSIK